MKNKFILMIVSILLSAVFTGCGQDPAITEFKNEIDSFCTTISEIDTSINNIDAASENATTQLFGYLDDLDEAFLEFADLDFPTEYDYLESLADESGSYMTEAVKSYKDAYSNGYNEALAEYAKENYSRAYKRIQIIITFLHGEEPENVDLVTTEE